MRKYLLVPLIFLFLVPSVLAQTGKVEPIGLPEAASVAENIRQALDAKGYRVVLDDGSVACEIWLRKDIPASGKKEAEGALFPQLAESTMIGIISFPKPGADYRGDAIKPGFYTLRYELLPNDGNHLGVAPNRDFLLLVPLSSDPDPKATFTFQQLVDLSRKAMGGAHPGPLSMVQGEATVPGVSKDEQEHWIFSAKLPLTSGEVAFGLVVKGTAPQ